MLRKLLIVDDDELNRKLLINILSKEYDIIEAANGAEALDILHRSYKYISAILLDLCMPVMDGYSVLEKMRDNAALSQLPVIVTTASSEPEAEVRALSLGANDFIVKPFNPTLILHCLRNTINLRETASIVNALQRDKLTGLYNRETFFDKASAMIREQKAGYYIMSCFDIDNFKLINDQYGAEEGDRILREIGAVTREDIYTINGIAGRIAADNFAALYPARYENKSFDLFTRLKDKDLISFGMGAASFSIGRYAVSDKTLTPSAIYDRAYIAKQSVKGRYDRHIAHFDDAMLEKLVREQQITGEMDDALSARQFEVWFQPQFNHSTSALVGSEALVRWRHPEKGLISPAKFIPVFEQNGFIYELDKFVWEESCRYLRKWSDEGRKPLPISVNISRYDLFRSDLLTVLNSLIDNYKIPVDLLRFEITESAFAQSTDQILNVVKLLINNGFTIEIDDFGSGYSSLNTLKDVPADVLKLDMKFLESRGISQRGGNIIESVVRMAKWLDTTVIAEGVETKEQADYLKSIGCHYVQGYLYAPPMSASDYEEFSRCHTVERRFFELETIENLDNNAFWNPESMETLIFNSYIGGACIYELHNRHIEMLRANDKYMDMLGSDMTIDDVLKLNWEDYLDEENLGLFISAMESSVKSGEEQSVVYMLKGLPNCFEKIYLRSSLRVIASSGDRFLVYCTNENITAQKEAENEISTLVDDIPGGFCRMVVTAEMKVRMLYCNDGFCRLCGLSHDEIMSKFSENVLNGIHPDDLSELVEKFRATQNQSELRAKYRLVHGHDDYITVMMFARVVKSAEGQIYLNTFFTDISAQSDSKVLQSEVNEYKRLRQFNDNIQGGLATYVCTTDKIKLTYFNDTFCDILGFSHDEYEHYAELNPISMVYADDLPLIFSQVRRLIETEAPISCVYRLQSKRNNSLRWIDLRGNFAGRDGENVTINTVSFDITDRINAEKEAYKLAESDPLTGILNRVAFTKYVTKSIADTNQAGLGALLLLDIDGFKLLNDSFGHAAGDQSLIEISQTLMLMTGENDIVGRLGGDEFTIYLSKYADHAAIAKKAEQITTAMRKSYSIEVQISASIGIAVYPNDGCDFETLYRKADLALYHVKSNGKDNYGFYEDKMNGENPQPDTINPLPLTAVGSDKIKRRMLIVDDNELNRDMLSSLFVGEYIIDTAENGSEALMRLRRYGSGISVVLLDLVMPGMDGFTVLETMRVRPEIAAVPVVVVSGMDEREAALRTIKCGASDFVTKPVDPELLKLRVASAVAKAENERLRAQNSFLALRGADVARYKTALEGNGIAMIEFDPVTGIYDYDKALSLYIAGSFDSRPLYVILKDDGVCTTEDADKIEACIKELTEDPSLTFKELTAPLLTVCGNKKTFAVKIIKRTDEFQIGGKLIITLERAD